MTNFVTKMTVMKDLEVFVSDLSKLLAYMGIDKLNIFSINLSNEVDCDVFETGNVRYVEIGVFSFIEFVSTSESFFELNHSSLYILRDGTFRDMKYIFSQVGKYGVNLVRGGNLLYHVLSPLDLRLSFYFMALNNNMNINELQNSNIFNTLNPKRYLPFDVDVQGQKKKK
jgi:hypothetical protein